MAITSIGSYITTADEIVSHWTDVDADRLASSLPALALQGGYSLADFTAERDAVQTGIINLEGLENVRDLATGNRDTQKQNLRERLRQFRAALDIHLRKTAYFRAAPKLPNLSSSESKFLRPFDDIADLWARIDADTGVAGFTPPLLLQAGYALAGFTADLAAMRTQFRAVTDAENDQDIARKRRDNALNQLRERMQQYRSAIALEYSPGHPFFESLPDLTTTSGGSGGSGGGGSVTPDPVTASGIWDDVTSEAVIDWSGSTDPNLANYVIRMTPSPTYDNENAVEIASMSPGTLQLRTTFGVVNPGDTASYRVFVVLASGDEAGSNTVVISRP